MTEAEWLACDDPRKMLELLRGRVSERKLRLFAVACWRRNPYPVAPEVGPAIDLYEAYADGKATGDALRDAFARIEFPPDICGAVPEAEIADPRSASELAVTAASAAARWSHPGSGMERPARPTPLGEIRDLSATPSAPPRTSTPPGWRGTAAPSRSSPGQSTTSGPSTGCRCWRTRWRTPAARTPTS